jgi:hypothetical protein
MTPREERLAYGRPHLLYAVDRGQEPDASGAATATSGSSS